MGLQLRDDRTRVGVRGEALGRRHRQLRDGHGFFRISRQRRGERVAEALQRTGGLQLGAFGKSAPLVARRAAEQPFDGLAGELALLPKQASHGREFRDFVSIAPPAEDERRPAFAGAARHSPRSVYCFAAALNTAVSHFSMSTFDFRTSDAKRASSISSFATDGGIPNCLASERSIRECVA
jgi:hypothetical protein